MAHDNAASRPPDDPWPGKKKILAIADPEEWYSSPGYHHDAASHTLATVERLGRESGAWVTIIRTDMRLLTKQPIPGFNVRNLNNFDAVFYMGEGPWNITDQQKADLLSFVHDDGKGFIAGHAGNGGHLLLWPEYAQMIGGNLIGEFPTASMPIILEDPSFPGVQGFPREFNFKDQFTIVGPNYSRDVDHVIMRMDATKFPQVFSQLRPEGDFNRPVSLEKYRANFERLAALRTDGDFPIVWARNYGKGRVWYSTIGHLEESLDDHRVQEMYIGAIKWALGLENADITPRPFPGK
ncbi:ThuA domain-containing protein [Paracidobacterium acidisoli]|uniref:ThuA domain-containing protein n=1 Tax=Paracidobacterium acidisoli TaxID=2303751 RepID=UPI001313E072|nr:ThuA domain-containing protein [Paracidobacterium acidisoli]MBT9332390.1 ThuA domain-containing protein [Paracidobacterium acidisoli]